MKKLAVLVLLTGCASRAVPHAANLRAYCAIQASTLSFTHDTAAIIARAASQHVALTVSDSVRCRGVQVWGR